LAVSRPVMARPGTGSPCCLDCVGGRPTGTCGQQAGSKDFGSDKKLPDRGWKKGPPSGGRVWSCDEGIVPLGCPAPVGHNLIDPDRAWRAGRSRVVGTGFGAALWGGRPRVRGYRQHETVGNTADGMRRNANFICIEIPRCAS